MLAATVVLSVLLTAVHVPSAVLFASFIAGVLHAAVSPTPLTMPPWLFRVGQALIGLTIASLIGLESLGEVGSAMIPVIMVTLATIGVSLVAGRVLAMRKDVSRVTGAFAMVAGGASGVIAVAHDLGADDRVVAVVQYLRVLVLLVTMPLVTTVVFAPQSGPGTFVTGDASMPGNVAYVVVGIGVGLPVARMMRSGTAVLLGPLVIGVAIGQSGWLGTPVVPIPLQWLAFALIGGQVGLRFTRASLASITRMLPSVLVIIGSMVTVTAGLGALLAWLTPVDGVTAYLATTPGGMFAVLATAADSGADVTYVMSMQILRLLLVLSLTPLLARFLQPRSD